VKNEFTLHDFKYEFQGMGDFSSGTIVDSKPQRRRRKPTQYNDLDNEIPEAEQSSSSKRFSLRSSEIMQHTSNLRPRTPMLMEYKNVKIVDLDNLQEEKKFACTKCPRRFSSKHGMIQHLKYECMQEPRFKCVYCNFKSKRPWVINEHLRRHHKGRPMKYFEKTTTM
jgi:hypothetical protein